jgi:hypothetical protein
MDFSKMLDKIYQRILDIVSSGKSVEEIGDLSSTYQLFADMEEKESIKRARNSLFNDNLQSSFNKARIQAFKREGNINSLKSMLSKN